MNPIISFNLIQQYLTTVKFYDVTAIKSFKSVSDTVIRVTFSTDKRGYSFNLSRKDLNKFYLSRMVEKSKAVNLQASFDDIYTRVYSSNSGKDLYSATIFNCDCPDFRLNQTPVLLGVRVCKHTIATARAYGINSFSALADSINHRAKLVKGA